VTLHARPADGLGEGLMRALAAALLLFSSSAWSAAAADAPRVLDSFDDAAPWSVVASTQVSGAIRMIQGAEGKALCLDYDFHGVSGYVGIGRALPLDYPADYAFDFRLRGESPTNNLEFKLVDASGDNVWWVQRANRVFTPEWESVRYRKRHVSKAWGPSPETELKHSEKLELTLASGSGGKGSVCFDQLRFTPLVPDDGAPLAATRRIDRDGLRLDLGRVREFGGLGLHWPAGTGVRYVLAASDDGRSWRTLRTVAHGDGGDDWLALPESESRYLRIFASDRKSRLVLPQLRASIEPLAFGATPNAFLQEVAARSPAGDWPRGLSGQQAYWTIIGVDGGAKQALMGEDGAIELGKGGPSVEPFVLVDGKRVSWATVESTQTLQDGYLPIPSVRWTHPDFTLEATAFAAGAPGDSRLLVRYRLRNQSTVARTLELLLAARPLQVNPPSQFLNTAGGFSPVRSVLATRDGGSLHPSNASALKAGAWQIRLRTPASSVQATSLESGDVAAALARSQAADYAFARLEDPQGMAGILWRFRGSLAPGQSRDVIWEAPLEPESSPLADAVDYDVELARLGMQWHDKLDAVKFEVPPQAQRMIESLRYALATMLISRQGPRLQPGTRSYSRAWIRDGAMIDEALLRLGREDVAKDFVRWYAPYQFKDGKVPCCVDDRGSDPVPENDSHGELVYAIAEAYRYTGDRALLESLWPNVLGAVGYMDELRASERTEANRALNPAFYGLMPASISHEGYSAKAMHSYWDDFWALRGYRDAVQIAQWLGHEAEAQRFAAARDQFAADLKASLAIATKTKGIEFIPGSAELGDFDPTSTTIALAPADAADLLPGGLLERTFARYWSESQARTAGTRAWKDYTPYELRTVGSFVRLGHPERAQAMLGFFFKGQQPQGWRQWAEVVSSTPRKPFFLGDLPHAWVASDYARSVLDLFAYERARDHALVIAAGLPLDWFGGKGVAIEGLRTPQGPLSYSLHRDGGRIVLELAAGTPPPGGFVLALPQAKVRAARINGKRAKWRNGELRIARAPARVELELAPAR
jgi:hypothetical protein